MLTLDVLTDLNHGVLLGALLTLVVAWSWLAWQPIQHLRHRREGAQREQMLRLSLPPDKDLPHVLIQLPIYNEPRVVRRLTEAMAGLDWPREKLHIQLLDDSTDETLSILREQTASLRERGYEVMLLHRPERTDFKAGALREGLKHSNSEYVSVFDADFAPERDFLRLCLRPLIAEPRLAFVQARWGFTNGGQNLVTRAQRAILDAYFGIIKSAQSWSRTIVDYNGTCAVWRRQAIDDAGGWSADTLGEDVDLSYRAQLRGWHAEYLSSVLVPGELPDTLDVLQAQQSRWGMLWGQQARKHFLALWRSDLELGRKFAVTAQMLATTSGIACYVAVAAGVVDYLLGSWTWLAASLAGIAILESAGSVVVMATMAQVTLRGARPWAALRDAVAGILLFALLHFRASVSVLGGLLGKTAAFVRTPKRGDVGAGAEFAPCDSGLDKR